MLLNRASRCFNNFHNVSPCFAVEVAFNASHLSSFSMLVPHNKQEQGCKVNDAFSFRAGQLTHVSKLFWRPLAWTSSHIFAIVSDRFRIIPKLANVNPLHIGEKQFVNLLGMTAYWSILVVYTLITCVSQSMSCSENTVPHSSLPNNVPEQLIWQKKQNRQNRQRSWPQLSSVSALDLATADHSITERLPILARLFYSASQRNSNVQVPAPKPKKQVWWISIS